MWINIYQCYHHTHLSLHVTCVIYYNIYCRYIQQYKGCILSFSDLIFLRLKKIVDENKVKKWKSKGRLKKLAEWKKWKDIF